MNKKNLKFLIDLVNEQKIIDIESNKDTTERDLVLNLLNKLYQEELLSQ